MEASALSAPAGLNRTSVTSRLLPLRSDDQLVALFRMGNDEAFRVIHDRYRQRLFSYARQMLGGSRSDAEDVLQDVFLRAYRALRADERPVSLRAWLYRVAHNRCVDHLRRPVPAPADVFQVSRSPLHDPLVEAEQREELRRLVADVHRLPEQQRSALLMREIDGMSYAELAEALETSVPAIKSLLVRARIGLVEAIEARDADCADIRHDLAAAYDRGVRASGQARRHLRDCAACTSYRAQLREVRQSFAALSPGPAPVSIFAKLLGLGGASSGAASGSAVVGGGAAAVSATKVAAVVCCAAALTGGAASEVKQFVAPAHRAPAKHHRTAAARTTAPLTIHQQAVLRGVRAVSPAAVGHAPQARHAVPGQGAIADLAPIRPVEQPPAAQDETTGGEVGPDETAAPADTDAGATTEPKDSLTGLLTNGAPTGASAGEDDTASGTTDTTAPAGGSSGSTSTKSGDSQPTASSSSSDTSGQSGTGSGSAPPSE